MVGTDRQMTYKIVGSGSNETNPAQGKISDESPVGKALMDRCVGDVVEVETPGGVKTFKILEISKYLLSIEFLLTDSAFAIRQIY